MSANIGVYKETIKEAFRMSHFNSYIVAADQESAERYRYLYSLNNFILITNLEQYNKRVAPNVVYFAYTARQIEDYVKIRELYFKELNTSNLSPMANTPQGMHTSQGTNGMHIGESK